MTKLASEEVAPLAAMRVGIALTLPTSLFAAPEDWGSPALGERIDSAAQELAQVIKTGVGRAIAEAAWSGYQHQFGGRAARAAKTIRYLDFDSTLMQLATGGPRPQRR